MVVVFIYIIVSFTYDFSPFKIVNVGNSHCDDGIGGCGAHLPWETNQKVEWFSMKMNWRLTERLLYNTESGRKEREVIRSGSVPQEGDSEETEINYAEAFISDSSHTGSASAGVRHGKASILDWCDEQDGCGRPGLHLWGAQTCLPAPEAGGEGKLKPYGWLTGFPQLPSPWLSLNWADASAPLAPHPTPHDWGQNHAVRPWAGSHLRCSLSRVGTATVGVLRHQRQSGSLMVTRLPHLAAQPWPNTQIP